MYLTSPLLIDDDVTLDIAPGTEIRGSGSEGQCHDITVLGYLEAHGTEVAPVKFRQQGDPVNHPGLKIHLETNAELIFNHVESSSIVEILATEGSDDAKIWISDCDFDMQDGSGFAVDGELASEFQIFNTSFIDCGTIRLPSSPRPDYIKLHDVSITMSDKVTQEALLVQGEVDVTHIDISNACTGIKCVGDVDLTMHDPQGEASYILGRGPTVGGSDGIVAEGSSELDLWRVYIGSFEKGILLDDNSGLKLRDSWITDCRTGAYMYRGISYADMGTQFDYGNNCIDSQDTFRDGLRVFNRASTPCFASGNYWFEYPPSSSLFLGNVWWGQYQQTCNNGIAPPGGGGAMSIAMASPLDPEPESQLQTTFEAHLRQDGTYLLNVRNAPESGSLTVGIYSVSGRKIRDLEFPGSGTDQSLTWNGADREGRLVSSGVYFARVVVGNHAITRKLVVVH